MPHLNEVNKKLLTEGILGQYVHGESTTLGWVTIQAGSKLPSHHHPHEQITLMLEGKMEMQIGDESFMLEPGTVKVIGSNVPHSAIAHTDCVLIDVFSPVREDYKD
jgi:quercetin dioxygenase-like cupin family protein